MNVICMLSPKGIILGGGVIQSPRLLARGAFIGLTLRHRCRHMMCAMIEGVAYGLKDSFTLIREVGLGEICQVCVSEGGIKSIL